MTPQTVNKQGLIQGHQHVVIQKIGNAKEPLDPQKFEFFKGLDQPPKGKDLTASVDKGLPQGEFRICTLTGTFGHQPVIMPVAQRGSQDDCIRVTVG